MVLKYIIMVNTDRISADTETEIASSVAPPPTKRMVDIEVKNQNDALQLMVGFLTRAQQKGVFTIEESAKIWQCIEVFRG
jgi:hypothetical protein